ncbi:GHMP kinase [Candidatus Methylospira mobilis]|nr:beta-ribofuranosylaminobenzene 5'-phosphate synthase family protein [Candidatus Methylospira mobilis]WNV06545.1 GHMP kinase [Candidatus Methylospira mobilis]
MSDSQLYETANLPERTGLKKRIDNHPIRQSGTHAIGYAANVINHQHTVTFSMSASHLSSPHRQISVTAPARLHMGFLDLNGSLGRRFGSIGVAVNELATRLLISGSDSGLQAEGPQANSALKSARLFCDALGTDHNVHIRIEEAIPGHIGLGSGTQLALAVGAGLAAYFGLQLSVREIARAVGRGARSGIGIAVFEQGGFIVDGGRGSLTETPPVISRINVPEEWRIILLFDARGQGLHGAQEIDAFRKLPPFPAGETARLCHRVLMQALPAIAEADLPGFGAVITDLQKSVGDHFASVQGGRFTSPEVGDALDWLAGQGAAGLGQSSWGPTGFCLVENNALATKLMDSARARYPMLSLMLSTARNQGAEVVFTQAVSA